MVVVVVVVTMMMGYGRDEGAKGRKRIVASCSSVRPCLGAPQEHWAPPLPKAFLGNILSFDRSIAEILVPL